MLIPTLSVVENRSPRARLLDMDSKKNTLCKTIWRHKPVQRTLTFEDPQLTLFSTTREKGGERFLTRNQVKIY